MSQQVGITLGTPVMSALVVGAGSLLSGLHLAVVVNGLLCLATAVLVRIGLRER